MVVATVCRPHRNVARNATHSTLTTMTDAFRRAAEVRATNVGATTACLADSSLQSTNWARDLFSPLNVGAHKAVLQITISSITATEFVDWCVTPAQARRCSLPRV
jgi:hypothetical protein